MNKEYLSVTIFCLVCGSLAAFVLQKYFMEMDTSTCIVGVISGTTGSMIAYIWHDKRQKRFRGKGNDR